MTHASLFSGLGGFDLAASWMGWRNAFHCEIDGFCSRVLQYHFPDAEHYTDIRTTDFTEWRGRVDILTGAFPASPSALPDEGGERKMTATSGRRCCALYRRSDPLGLSVRTLLASSRWYSPARRLLWRERPLYSERITRRQNCGSGMSSRLSARTLSVRDIQSSRLLFRLVPSEHRTGGTGYGSLRDLLPTPVATEIVEHPAAKARRLKDRSGTRLNNLSSGARFGLLPTPVAHDGKNSTLPPSGANRKGGLTTMFAKSGLSLTGADSQLNPRYVGEMMGFPPDWTELPFLDGERSR